MDNENMEEYDYIIVGSSLSNALLTNVLSWKGFKVLSIDENDYYGDYTAALSVDQICDQFKDVFINDENISQNKTRFGVDLIPSYILCDSKMIKYIMNFNIYRYLEVVKLDNFYTFNSKNDSFDKLKTTKQDIFTDTSISPITKRTIMKCIKFLVEEVNEENQIWKDYKDKPIMDLFTDKFGKLPVNLINEFVFTICNCFDCDHLTTKTASDIITKFFKSYNVYGNFPALLTKYGGLGEIIQGVYRSAALIGNVIRLRTTISKVDGNIIELSDGEMVKVNERIIISNNQNINLKALNKTKLTSNSNVYRSHLFVKKNDECKLKWSYSNINGSLITFPPNSVLNETDVLANTVQLMVLSDSLERTSNGYVTLSIMATNKTDLDLIIGKYEKEGDVVFKFNYEQNINYSTEGNDESILITPDVQEPLSLDLDQFVEVAIGIYNQIIKKDDDDDDECDFMSVNLPNNDE